jgi:hypothetical protein
VRIELGEEKSPDLAPPSRWDDFKQLFKELAEDLQK